MTEPTSNVIEFPVIPRKPADRVGQIYRCTLCGNEELWTCRVTWAVYCYAADCGSTFGGCGAEMRPVEMEAK